jgi:hypothetical protein
MAMARTLTTPGNGDIEFTCDDENYEPKHLYALYTILITRCNYYKTREFLRLHLTPEFNFEKGKIALNKLSKPDKGGFLVYHKVPSEVDFNLLHTILYYLYTDRITFGSNIKARISDDLPKLCSTEDIYILADQMQLEELKTKALKFLELSCTPENITERIMSKFAELYPPVEEVFRNYFTENWAVIKDKREFKDYFIDDDAVVLKNDMDEIRRAVTKLLELMTYANFAK